MPVAPVRRRAGRGHLRDDWRDLDELPPLDPVAQAWMRDDRRRREEVHRAWYDALPAEMRVPSPAWGPPSETPAPPPKTMPKKRRRGGRGRAGS
jgi:hypothetical protein